ncbi:thiolase C-terminal domain-containing protein [Yinghuangia sp. YIM S09857]|uniref:thiolase C-terminal domain-containing protein n=1 Tax=Yinghuangia sp. YIM S09857 TaxID=3436929 RepID=UPI003F52ADDE
MVSRSGRLRPGLALPFDTNGGGVSYGQPGMYGLLLQVEALRQVLGECGTAKWRILRRPWRMAPAASSRPVPQCCRGRDG